MSRGWAWQTDTRPGNSTRSRLGRGILASDGSMLIETAFVLPAFFLLLFGIFEFSIALTNYCSATYAIRVAARYASVHSATSLSPASSAAVKSMVQSSIFMPGVSSSSVNVNYTNFYAASQGNYVGDEVVISITWNQAINLPYYHNSFYVGSRTCRMIVR